MSYGAYGTSALRRQQQEEQKRSVKKERVVVKHTMPTKEKMLYLMMVLGFVAISCVLISRYSQVAEYNFQVQTMKDSIQTMSEENNYLRLQVAEKSSPERILEAAQKMGMIRDENNIIASYGKQKTSSDSAMAGVKNGG